MKLTKLRIELLFICLLVLSISLHSQDIAPAEFEIALNKPVRISKISEGHYFIDFGKAYFGTLSIRSRNHKQRKLVVHVGEKLSDSNQIDRSPNGTIRYQRVKIPSLEPNTLKTIELNPYKRNTSPPAIILPDSFGVVLPFRYCEIENLQGSIENIEIWQKAFHYKFNDELSSFSSSDTILDAIWELCKHSIKATSFAGFYIDGDRERIPYEADAYINQLSHYSLDTVYSLARRTNQYFIDHPTWPTEWILHTAMMFYADYQYTGDLDPLTKYYDKLQAKALVELSREDGLISTRSSKLDNELMGKLGFSDQSKRIRDIVDWPQNERDDYELLEINTVVNAFYYENLRILSLLAGALGEKKDSADYIKKANQVKKTINEKLFDESRGVYVDGEGSDHASLHANMIPLAFNIVPLENIGTVVQLVKSKGMACSVYGAQYLLEGLLRNRESKYALDLITETNSDRSWWNMIETGTTITLEAWDIKYKPNLDWNHAWGTAPLNIITRYLWGIAPLRPGFSTAQISPQLDELEFSEIKVPTIKGIIHASYKRVNKNHKIYEIEIPENMNAQFILPDQGAEIKLNKKTLSEKQTSLLLESGLNIIEIRNKPAIPALK